MSKHIYNIIKDNEYYKVKKQIKNCGKYFENYDKCCNDKSKNLKACYLVHYERFINCINKINYKK
jgi:hypothetical protein